MRVKDKDIRALAAFERLHRRRTRVARGRADNTDTSVTLRQDVIEQMADDLHREVFKREGWAME